MKQAKPRALHILLEMTMLFSLLLLLAGCSSRETTELSLTPFAYSEQFDSITPSWDNYSDSRLDIRIYLEPYKQSDFMDESLSFFTSMRDARIRIYDYLPQADVESFMVSGIGLCIAEQSPSQYLQYLQKIVGTKDIHDELVMAALAREITGANYNRRCLQTNIKELKNIYENDNPLLLEELPATIINGYIFYGDQSVETWKNIIEEVKE